MYKIVEANSKTCRPFIQEESVARSFHHTDKHSIEVLGNLQKRTVWIYNVSRLTFNVDHHFIKAVVHGRKQDEEYSMVASLPEAVLLPRYNPDSFETTFALQDGKRLAQDFINPDNLGLNQDQDNKEVSLGRNLNSSGVFWSMNNPPLQSEIDSEKRRMEKHYSFLNRQTVACALFAPLELNALSPEHKEAYRYGMEEIEKTQETQNVRE